MKRFYTIIVLLGIVVSVVLVGCNQEKPTPPAAPDTNAPAAPAAPSTNK
jgi:hypothetical protein